MGLNSQAIVYCSIGETSLRNFYTMTLTVSYHNKNEYVYTIVYVQKSGHIFWVSRQSLNSMKGKIRFWCFVLPNLLGLRSMQILGFQKSITFIFPETTYYKSKSWIIFLRKNCFVLIELCFTQTPPMPLVGCPNDENPENQADQFRAFFEEICKFIIWTTNFFCLKML